MKVLSIALCKKAEYGSDGFLNIQGAGITGYSFKEVSGQLSPLFIWIRLVKEPEDESVQFFRVNFKYPDGFLVEGEKHTIEPRLKYSDIVMDIGFQVTQFGLYFIEIWTEKEILVSLPFEVILKS